MSGAKRRPGVSRTCTGRDEGLARLEKLLASGANISSLVLAQWIVRYGEHARQIIRKYHKYRPELDQVDDDQSFGPTG